MEMYRVGAKALVVLLTCFFILWRVTETKLIESQRHFVRGEIRIVGGEEINITDAPYQVSIQLGGSMICGGAVLSPRYIATAAHCFSWSANESYFSVRAGTTDKLLGGTIHRAENITIHPQYDDILYDYDVALIRIDPAIDFSERTQPITIYEGDVDHGNISITGWGTTSENDGTSRFLQSVVVPVVPWATCNEEYAEYGGLSNRMFCAGSEGHDSCYGDSGGPVVFEGQLLGLVSWAAGCARLNYPGVNVKLGHPEIRRFIIEITGV